MNPAGPSFEYRLAEGELRREWLLTNAIGAFAMGTARSTPTRRYHALLVAPRRPPLDRIAALHAVDDHLVVGPGALDARLTSFRFAGCADPQPPAGLQCFEADPGALAGHGGCRWTFSWKVGRATVTVRKSLRLARLRNAMELAYEIDAGPEPFRLTLRPLASLRDFHALGGECPIDARTLPDGVVLARDGFGLDLRSPDARFQLEPEWWRGLEYEQDRLRGQDFREDLFCPGRFTLAGTGRGRLRLFASTDAMDAADLDREAAEHHALALARAANARRGTPPSHHRAVARLAASADAFVVRRGGAASDLHGRPRTSILAGFPWFADWGRDSMISLPGLLLATGRLDEARSVLEAFAAHRRAGLIPNRFDDHGGDAHYNTADASLWFIHAACAWAGATGGPMPPSILAACMDVIGAYRRGTDQMIGLDAELGLIRAGDAGTQLTWMDAARDGVVFTPRHGACVEINALWHHGLLALAGHLGADPVAFELRALAMGAAAAFRRHFWNPELACCFDRLEPGPGGGWRPVAEVRPNQILAASLEHSPLSREQRSGVVARVRDRLCTPLGVRTLDPGDGRYRARFEGSMFERDGAYHNGTAWPWLIGPLVEAMARLGTPPAEMLAVVAPLVDRIEADCLGHIAEVFDAEPPQTPGGCPAQAWSTAETLRALLIALRGLDA